MWGKLWHEVISSQPPLPRYLPAPSNMLFEDDPGVMSEVETSSTGFRRGGKQRSSLPVVRTPSKTLERPLGKHIYIILLNSINILWHVKFDTLYSIYIIFSKCDNLKFYISVQVWFFYNIVVRPNGRSYQMKSPLSIL